MGQRGRDLPPRRLVKGRCCVDPGPQEGRFTFQYLVSVFVFCCKEQDSTLTSHSPIYFTFWSPQYVIRNTQQ